MLYRVFFKRLLDIITSFILIIVLSPILILVSILLIFQNKGNPFFYQDRGKASLETICPSSSDAYMCSLTQTSHKHRMPRPCKMMCISWFLRRGSIDRYTCDASAETKSCANRSPKSPGRASHNGGGNP